MYLTASNIFLKQFTHDLTRLPHPVDASSYLSHEPRLLYELIKAVATLKSVSSFQPLIINDVHSSQGGPSRA